MTPGEYQKMLGFKQPIGQAPASFPPEAPKGGLGVVNATTVDHVAAGKMGPVKDQGGCGSCWAFAANTALEGTHALQQNLSQSQIPHFSEQQLVDCTLTGNEYNQ